MVAVWGLCFCNDNRNPSATHSAKGRRDNPGKDAVAEPTLTGITSHDWVQVLLQESRLGSDAMISDEAFNATNATNSTAAAVTGVQLNKAGDLVIFLSALGTNIGIVIVSFLLLAILRRVLPRVFSSRRTGEGPKQTEPSPASGGIFGWVSLSWRPTDEVEEAAGLDHAMYLQFLDLGSRLCLLIGLPCVLVLCPLHFFVGGGAAGEDRLSSIGMGNVQHGSWLCWLHAFFVWYAPRAASSDEVGFLNTYPRAVFAEHAEPLDLVEASQCQLPPLQTLLV